MRFDHSDAKFGPVPPRFSVEVQKRKRAPNLAIPRAGSGIPSGETATGNMNFAPTSWLEMKPSGPQCFMTGMAMAGGKEAMDDGRI